MILANVDDESVEDCTYMTMVTETCRRLYVHDNGY
jgi:hypothetical protein